MKKPTLKSSILYFFFSTFPTCTAQKAHFWLKMITWPGFCHSLINISLTKSIRLLPKSEVFQRILWNGMMASLQNLGHFFKTWLTWQLPIIKMVPRIFLSGDIFSWNILKPDIESQNLAFFKTILSSHFKRYWSFIWIHSSLGLNLIDFVSMDLKLHNWYCHM